MAFISEILETEIMRAFADVAKIPIEQVRISTSETGNENKITLDGVSQATNDATTTKLTITESKSNEYRFEGCISTSSGLRDSTIDRVIRGNPKSLPEMVKTILATAKVKKGLQERLQNQLKGYLQT
jgi:hypothetical protein